MHTTSKRVVITGLGAITPVGNTAAEFWQSLTNGVSGIGPITRFDASDFTTRIAGEVKGFEPTQFIDKKEAIDYWTMTNKPIFVSVGGNKYQEIKIDQLRAL